MLRLPVLTTAFALFSGTLAFAQLPPQPPPVSLGQANEHERAACHPDVIKHCRSIVDANNDDVLGILACLQANRSRISAACQEVLASHGQ